VEVNTTNTKGKGKKLFAKGGYLSAIYFYGLATEIDPLHATLFASRILCWLWMGEENLALADAVQCRIMHPRWPKAWYREGVALGFKVWCAI